MSLPSPLLQTLEAILGPILAEEAVGGGDISRATRLRLSDGRQVLLKWPSRALPGLFTAERRGLELLQRAGAVRIPIVLAHGEEPAFIALEWLEHGAKSGQSAAILGVQLALLHGATSATFGLDHDNFIGATPQPNQPSANWVTFFQEQRLGFQIELAGRNGLLSTWQQQRLEQLVARLAEWLPPHPPASLLHGDLWGGNWLALPSGQPALIDPAVYYGHREAELAFTQLFGGFPPTFYAAYHEAWPLEPGYEERKELYNLYHLLNHLNLFGQGYGSSVDAILRRFI